MLWITVVLETNVAYGTWHILKLLYFLILGKSSLLYSFLHAFFFPFKTDESQLKDVNICHIN